MLPESRDCNIYGCGKIACNHLARFMVHSQRYDVLCIHIAAKIRIVYTRKTMR